MKKRLISSAMFVLCLSTFTFAQVEKGNLFFGGSSNIEFNATKEKITNGGTTTESSKYSDFDFRPQVGYFVINKLPVGLFMDLDIDKMKMIDSDNEYKWTSFMIGPFVRYYITDLDGFMPYGEAAIGFGAGNNKSTYMGTESDEKYKMLTYRLGIGGTYFVTDNVGIDLFLGYGMDQETYENNEEADRSDSETTYKYGGLDINLGFVISLGK